VRSLPQVLLPDLDDAIVRYGAGGEGLWLEVVERFPPYSRKPSSGLGSRRKANSFAKLPTPAPASALATLAAMRARGHRLALLTNGGRRRKCAKIERYDLAGAARAGLATVSVDHTGAGPPREAVSPDRVVRGLAELPAPD
jgi:FMN phosphatase YigB (HAD superfamily)